MPFPNRPVTSAAIRCRGTASLRYYRSVNPVLPPEATSYLSLLGRILDARSTLVDLGTDTPSVTVGAFLPQTRARQTSPVRAASMDYMPASNLRLMLAAADDEFSLHYQPSVDAQTGEVAHLEALLRWPGGPSGYVTEQVVRHLESSSLILEVGRSVLNRACMDLAELRRSGNPRLSMSVNVSAAQAADPNFVDVIERTLRRYRIPTELFQVEITETMLDQTESIPDFVRRLCDIGVTTLVDDFGLGYNNLGLLRSVPVAGLKIDRSFVAGLEKDRRSALIAESIIGLARNLKICTIAEGVETPYQERWLRRHGVDRLQGWAYSKAVPLNAIRNLLLCQPWARKTAGGNARRSRPR